MARCRTTTGPIPPVTSCRPTGHLGQAQKFLVGFLGRNARLGLQYTGYNRFNGGSHYIDEVNGSHRKASDNNTTMLFLWLAI